MIFGMQKPADFACCTEMYTLSIRDRKHFSLVDARMFRALFAVVSCLTSVLVKIGFWMKIVFLRT